MFKSIRKMAKLEKVLGLVFSLTLIVTPFGCGQGQHSTGEISQSASISECGGFKREGSGVLAADQAGYCDAEVLNWQYDTASETLHLFDNRILLNCCGDHDMTIEEQEGVYVVTETDAPQDGGARCACMCVFDFNLKAEGISIGIIQIQIRRIVTNLEVDPEEKLVFEGSLDLSQHSGSVVLDETDVSPWCGQE